MDQSMDQSMVEHWRYTIHSVQLHMAGGYLPLKCMTKGVYMHVVAQNTYRSSRPSTAVHIQGAVGRTATARA